MKKVIWSLFDSETAITQELNDENYIVYSIGLPSSSAITIQLYQHILNIYEGKEQLQLF